MPQPPWGQGPVIDIGGRGFRIPAAPVPSRRLEGNPRRGPGRRPPLLDLLPGERRRGRRRPAVRALRADDRPGPHLKIPFIETVTLVPVQRQLKTEFGFRTTRRAAQSEFEQNAGTQAESLMLTGDLNVAVVEWIVQYKVKDPYKYLFKVGISTAPTARRRLDVPRHERGGDARGRRRPQRQRGADGRPREDPGRRQGAAAAAVRSLRDGTRGAADRAAGREPARPGQARVQRGEPGDPGEGAAHQRGLGRLQPDRAQRARRGRARRARRRGLRPRARQQRPRRRRAVRQHLRRVPQGARRHAQAALPRDAERGAAEDGTEAHHRRVDEGPAAAPQPRSGGKPRR